MDEELEAALGPVEDVAPVDSEPSGEVYRLAELRQGRKRNRDAWVYFCETESEADSLAETGRIAVAHRGLGAGLSRSCLDCFKGARVRVCLREGQDRAVAALNPVCLDLQVLKWHEALAGAEVDLSKVNVSGLLEWQRAWGQDIRAGDGEGDWLSPEAWERPQVGPIVPELPEANVSILAPGPEGSGSDQVEFAREVGRVCSREEIFIRAGGDMVVAFGASGQLEPVTASAAQTLLQQRIEFTQTIGRGAERREVRGNLSKSVAEMLLSSSLFKSQLREVIAVNRVRLPVIRECGRLELLPDGYDPRTKIFTRAEVDFRQDVSRNAATRYLMAYLGEFPFGSLLESEDGSSEVGDADRSLSVALAAMLSQFCDAMLPQGEQRPGFIYNANNSSAGKTLLAKLAIAPVHGPVETTPPPRGSNDELNKRLLSVVISGTPYAFIDNWRGALEHPALEAFLTAERYGDRYLSQSKMVWVDKRCILFLTSNNAVANEDMARRLLWCDLHVQERGRHPRRPLSADVILRDRGRLLACLWALVRSWDEVGRPAGSVLHKSFPAWSGLIGGILAAAGFENPAAKPKRELNEELQSMEMLCEAAYNSRPNMADEYVEKRYSELIDLARNDGLTFGGKLPLDEPGDKEKRAEDASMSSLFGRYSNTRVGGYWFKVLDAKKARKKRWRIYP